ncbi:MAG: hypothetical protein ACI4EF_05275 [Coprococcus sp.]
MKKTLCNLVKGIVFTVVLVFVLAKVTGLFKAKWISGTSASYVMDGMYELEDNSVNVCVLGTSQMVYGFSSMRLMEKYGISAYSCATGEQPVSMSYFCLKEIDKTQDIKTVIFDPSMLFEEVEESRYRNVLDYAPLSGNKLEAIDYVCRDKESIDKWSYVFPIIKYHTRWDGLTEKDFTYSDMNTQVMRGNIMCGIVRTNLTYEKMIVDYDEEDPTLEASAEGLEYLNKMVDYCKENGIDLILIKAPKLSWNKTMYNIVQEFADEKGIPYIDFNTEEKFSEAGFDMLHDIWNTEHLNVRGADKLTDYMGEYLVDNYGYSVDTEAVNKDMEAKTAYDLQHERRYFQSATDLDNLVELLEGKNYDILVNVSTDMSSSLKPSAREKLEKMGIKTDFLDADTKNYIAHFYKGEVLEEQYSDEPINYTGKLINGRGYRLQSDIDKDVNDVPSTLTGVFLYYNKNGINVSVYDSEREVIMDSFTILCNEAGEIEVYHNPDIVEGGN